MRGKHPFFDGLYLSHIMFKGRNIMSVKKGPSKLTKLALHCKLNFLYHIQSIILEDTGDSSRFGVYIHWPYCARKCTYCNFNKYVVDQVDQVKQ